MCTQFTQLVIIVHMTHASHRLHRCLTVQFTFLAPVLLARITNSGKLCRYQRFLVQSTAAIMQTTTLNKYFDNLANLEPSLIRYVENNLKLWEECGLVELVAEIVGMRARIDTEHKQRFQVENLYALLGETGLDDEKRFFERWGAFAVVRPPKVADPPLMEVRLNLVVAHMFANQLFRLLSDSFIEQINSRFEEKLETCQHRESANHSELFATGQEIQQRHFVSSHARTEDHEYWEECVSAFSVKQSRIALRDLDPQMHQLLVSFVREPENYLKPPLDVAFKKLRATRIINPSSFDYLSAEPGN